MKKTKVVEKGAASKWLCFSCNRPLIEINNAWDEYSECFVELYPLKKHDPVRKNSFTEHRFYCKKCQRLSAWSALTGCWEELDPIFSREHYSKKHNAILWDTRYFLNTR